MNTEQAHEILDQVLVFRRMAIALQHHPEPSPIRTKTIGDLGTQRELLEQLGGPDAVAEALAVLMDAIPDA